MKERPIIFSAPMVRAILEGRKTQTRRVVKPQPLNNRVGMVNGAYSRFPNVWLVNGAVSEYHDKGIIPPRWECPYGFPGDRLWMRETWNVARCSLDWETGTEFNAFEWDSSLYGNPQDYLSTEAPRGSSVAMLFYAADGDKNPSEFQPLEHLNGKRERPEIPWRPSIHMPRWASRLSLLVTGVRVERLQSINADDALAEGVTWDGEREHPRDNFITLWDSINGKRPGCTWDDNPWVWVVEFQSV